jgi:hypothetical protein
MSEQQTQVPEQTPKIVFTPEQQAKVDELIRAAMGRAGNDARATAARLEAEAEVLRAEVSRLNGDKSGLEREAKSAKDETVAVRKQNTIQAAATEHNFFNPQVVTKLTEDKVKWDEGKQKFIVLGDDGTARLDPISGDTLTVSAFLKEFGTQNSYLVRGDVKPGIGSREAQQPPHRTLGEKEKLTKYFGKGSDGKAANDLALSDPNEYKRQRHIARRLGLI